jgi:hypothetical protein
MPYELQKPQMELELHGGCFFLILKMEFKYFKKSKQNSRCR